MSVMEFKYFIEGKFVQWQNEQGKRKSLAEFAAYLGISQPLLSMWINGSKKPGSENIKMLHTIYGNEVLLALGKDPDLQYIQTHWEELDPAARKTLREQAEQYREKNEGKRVGKPKPARSRT